jgi:hypothetical protein
VRAFFFLSRSSDHLFALFVLQASSAADDRALIEKILSAVLPLAARMPDQLVASAVCSSTA